MSETATQLFTPSLIENALTYNEYRNLIYDLLKKGKVTGERQSEGLAEYTRMNVHRMNRLNKHTDLIESLKQILSDLDREMVWVVLTEGWCGDAAQNVPVINKIAEASENIELGFILRHDHEEIMDQYETNGARAIPKLIALDTDTLEEIGTWGPRPGEAQRLVYEEWIDDYPKKKWSRKLHKWYAENKTRNLQEEFESLLKKWQTS